MGRQDKKQLTRDRNQQDQHNDPNDEPHAHLHVLPEHLLAHAVGAAAEVGGGVAEALGLVAEAVDVLAALLDARDVLAHYADGVVDLLETGWSAFCGLREEGGGYANVLGFAEGGMCVG